MTKADIAREAARLGLDAGISHSCYDPAADGGACGLCDACRLRAKGFEEAGLPDPDALRGALMAYAVKEAFLTLQGEGVQAGRRAVFLRFAGCNLWSGREEDRRKAVCQFCDTDFVGTDGTGRRQVCRCRGACGACRGAVGRGARAAAGRRHRRRADAPARRRAGRRAA